MFIFLLNLFKPKKQEWFENKLFIAVIGALVGGLITFFSSYGVEIVKYNIKQKELLSIQQDVIRKIKGEVSLYEKQITSEKYENMKRNWRIERAKELSNIINELNQNVKTKVFNDYCKTSNNHVMMRFIGFNSNDLFKYLYREEFSEEDFKNLKTLVIDFNKNFTNCDSENF